MKRRDQIIVLLALLTLTFVVILRWSNRGNDDSDQSVDTAINQTRTSNLPILTTQSNDPISPEPNPFNDLMQTAIEFYGIVLDQDGKPVVSAVVSGSVLDSWNGSPISTTTGNDGKFSIVSKGTAITLKVEKAGYYRVEKGGQLRPSTQGFDFGVDDSPRAYKSDPSSPTIFHLRKAGNAVGLDKISGNPKVPRDGSLITVGLSKISNVALQISCRTMEDATQPPNAPYDWRCEISVDGGGIQEVLDEHSFTAPEGGYASSADIDMPKSLAPKEWNSRARKNYWLRFPDNTFGKINFMMNARGDHFAVIEGVRNPSPNDRNLEPKLDDR